MVKMCKCAHVYDRVLDIVPNRAGKREALEYLRQRFGFPTEKTVACGDSGNDVLMMSGGSRIGGGLFPFFYH